ncbi:uncharacterized protein LOC107274561 isoform X2 [Cephus cinctus]|uniref:Uncharacterized protein LOC107274561 isoform X2 n=1 Tax=Cephus cinctus TaxID=211228 RepID=A0AAJ7RW77_CEPCN|nr:uncharacterized protein LOC107274561 isoform X2 [Cephus cinctus]
MPRRKCLAILDLSNNRICCFCGLSTNNELEYGKIYEYDDIIAHYYCLLLSSNMQQNGSDDDGILGFLTEDIQKELSKAKKRQCRYCKKRGATLKCCNTKCKIIFHLPCGLRTGSLHQFFGEFRSFCKNHRPIQRIDPVVKTQLETLNNLLCYICYDSVNPHNVVETLWAPCCRKNAWYHRKCVQQLALSAGYFFKCPLCNNKDEFQKAMLNCGIFIPSQDASWELVPNAYEELLYRHDRCDAQICLCPKGRNYSSNETKWELTLCRLCGSQGIHVACGRLKNANTIWECTQCTDILNKSSQNVIPTIRQQDITLNSRYSDFTVMSKESDSDNSDSDISVGRNSPLTVKFDDERYLLPFSRNIIKPGPLSYKIQQVRKFIDNNKNLQSRSDHLNSEFNNKDFKNVSRLNDENSTTESDSLQENILKESETLITIDSDEEIVEIENPKRPIRCEPVSTITDGASNVSQYLSKFSRQMDLPSKNITEINYSMHNACLIDPGADEIVFSSTGEISPQCNVFENSETSGLNIKIVNVTSVSPEDFADVSDKSEESTSSSSALSVQSNGLCCPVDTEQSVLKRKINLRWSNINMLRTKKFADNDGNKELRNNPGPSSRNENEETMRNDKCEKRKQNFDICTSFFGVPNSIKKLAAKSQTRIPEASPNTAVRMNNVANSQSSGAEVINVCDTWDKAQSMEENIREVLQEDSPKIAMRRTRISRPIESDEFSSSRDFATKKPREESSHFEEQNSSNCMSCDSNSVTGMQRSMPLMGPKVANEICNVQTASGPDHKCHADGQVLQESQIVTPPIRTDERA